MRKFTSVVGNPPYTKDVEGRKAAEPIYQDFFEVAINIGKKNTLLTPARWFTSPVRVIKTFREKHSKILNNHVKTITYIKNSKEIFPEVEIAGGVSWWMFDWDYEGETQFIVDGVKEKKKRKLIENQTVSISTNKLELLRKTKEESKLEIRDFLSSVQLPFFKKHNSASTATMIKYTTENRQNDNDGRIRIPRHGWRYLPKEYIVEGKNIVPRDKFGLAFTHASNNSKSSLNDRTFFLQGGDTAKSTMVIILDNPEQAYNLYKYMRTKFVRRLIEGRLSSHNTSPQAYQDVPSFNFDETDPIDWSKSIPEIDDQLEEHFDLSDLHDWLQAVETPFANVPEEEYLEAWRSLGVNVSDAGEWY